MVNSIDMSKIWELKKRMNEDYAGVLAVGGLMAAMLMKDASAIKMLMNKGAVGKATRHAAKMQNVSKPIGRIHTNVSSPIGYNINNQLGPYKTVIKHPYQAGKSLIKDEPIWNNPALQKEYLADWRKRLNKERKAAGLGPLKMKDDEIIKRMNERQPVYRPAFWLETQKDLKYTDKIYRKNPKGYSFNRSDPVGKSKYDETIAIVKDRESGKPQTISHKHSIMAGFNKDVVIDGKRMYEDVWDVALNPSEKVERTRMWKDFWRNIRTGKPDTTFNEFNRYVPSKTLKERANDSKMLLSNLARLEARNLFSKVMDPVTLRGVMNPQDLL